MVRFSLMTLAREALRGHTGWPRQWRRAEPKRRYKAIIVGGGAHGLAAAWHLARDHGIRDVAVLERGWLGGGNTARNTTIIRSNYLAPESVALYDRAVTLWHELSQALDYNVMFSPRGVLTVATTAAEVREVRRRVHANRLANIDAEWLSPEEAAAFCPLLRIDGPRWPVLGAALQRRGGIARHDAVAWAYARAASALGVDIVEHCPVSALQVSGGRVTGVETARGVIEADVVGVSAAAGTRDLAASAGLDLPLEPATIQAFVSEPVRPALHCVVMAGALDVHVSQSDKGEFVFGLPVGEGFGVIEKAAIGLMELMPTLSRLRLLRQWHGTVDLTPDRSPILGPTPVDGLVLNCGWGTGGFKATPAAGEVLAHALATGRHHALGAPFGLDRFERGALVDERSAAAVAH
ncbi:sarcosine oxidase subunit beta family protein [Novispirillum sp. DQ9]|uniref:sarcosine oxidase subunit beta family protein n=1 Tax=Novispirillum sp. DQ9 TaxID=3398612 RepID=UPI003C7E5CDB